MPTKAGPIASAATADGKRGRARPKGKQAPRLLTSKFDLNHGVDVLADTASNTYHPLWTWDGRMYLKVKRSQGPSMEGLNDHSEPLKTIIGELAPNVYPDGYRLRDLFVHMHSIYKMFDPRPESDKFLSLPMIAILAADRWRIKCKHCLMLVRSKQYIPRDLEGLKEVLALLQLESEPSKTKPAGTAAAAAATPPESDVWGAQ